MTNYLYRMTAIIVVSVAIIASLLYKAALDTSAIAPDRLVEITGGLIAFWIITLVIVLIGLAEKYQNKD